MGRPFTGKRLQINPALLIFLLGLFGSFILGQQERPVSTSRSDLIRQRQEWFYFQRAYPHGEIPADARLKALDEMNRLLENERKQSGRRDVTPFVPASSSNWTSIGPAPINTQYWLSPVAGQVSAIAVDPRNASVVYIGTAAGGVWKTTNGGTAWVPLTDNGASLSIGSLVLDPSNPDIVYAGTGGPFGAYGAGILKSINDGVTWQAVPGPFAGPFGPDNFFGGGAKILSLSVHPSNGQILLAGVWRGTQSQAGIFRSNDGGMTWTQVLAGPGHDVQFDRTTGTAYAALGSGYGDPASGLYKSIDSGLTWTPLGRGGANPLPPAANIGEITMAAAPSNFSTIYVFIDNPVFPSVPTLGNLPGVFKSTDGGSNWTQIPVPATCCNPLFVHPANENVVFGGGTFPSSIFRSINGGSSWADITGVPNYQSAPHADAHSLALSADTGVLYFGNDGGIYKTTNVTDLSVNWTSLNSTLATGLFNPGLSIHPANINVSFAGTQDNGTLSYAGNLPWNEVTCGDGGWTAIDFSVPSTIYTTCQNIEIEKSTASGAFNSWVSVVSGINTSDRSAFMPPFVIDPSNSQRLYFGTYRLYQTNNSAGLWTAISPDLTGGSYHTITTIAVAPSDPDTVYVGTDDSHVQTTANATAGINASWADRSGGLPPRFVKQIAVDPNNPHTAYVTFSGFSGFFGDQKGHVFKTVSGGTSWTDISGNLPNIPVNDVVIDPDSVDTLYVATDIGVFITSNGGTTWSTLSNGLPRVIVNGLKFHHPTRTLRASTYGRGIWDLIVPPPKKRKGQIISD
jgi:photosystem II stability/assembly factor-like uncharacterized protein